MHATTWMNHKCIMLMKDVKHKRLWGTSLAIQWLGLHAATAGGVGSIPGRGTKIPHAARRSQKKKKSL